MNPTRPHEVVCGSDPRAVGSRAVLLAMLLVSACLSVHPSPVRQREYPEAFRTPEAAFRTWVAATLAGDPVAIRECYWVGLGEEEMRSWMQENLRPEAADYFRGSQFVGFRAVSAVEGRFHFRARNGAEEASGVMVLTREGWKLQSW